MKKILSLIIALILVFSMCAVTTVAFAEGKEDEITHSHTVTFRAENTDGVDGFKELVFDKHPATIEMNKSFMLDGTITVGDKEVVWYKDYDIVHQIFVGIRYIELKDEDFDKDDPTYNLTYATSEDAKPETHHATEHVTLAKAPKAEENETFAGWKVEFEGMADEYSQYIFPAGYVFNMPATSVTVTPVWEVEKSDGEGEEDTPATPIPELFYSDVIYVLYTSSEPREDSKNWDKCDVSKTFSVTSIGWWSFRFAVMDGANLAEKDHTLDWDADVLATTYDNVLTAKEGGATTQELLAINYTLTSFSGDITHPVISLSSSMESKQDTGLTAGTSYTISTSLDINDAGSSTTVTYQVYKKVGSKVEGADSDGWILIYNSKTKEVTEGYESFISTSGVITPSKDDISDSPVYKIVYSVVDAYGFFGVEKAELEEGKEYVEYHPEMLLAVHKAASGNPGNKAVAAWKIVLYVIAGLSAVGIVVLLCIKPKQAQPVDTRVGADGADSSDDSAQE